MTYNQQIKEIIFELRVIQKTHRYLKRCAQNKETMHPLFGLWGLFQQFGGSPELLSLKSLCEKYKDNAKLKTALHASKLFHSTTALLTLGERKPTEMWPMNIYGNSNRMLICEALIEEKQREILELLPFCTRPMRFLIHVLYGFG